MLWMEGGTVLPIKVRAATNIRFDKMPPCNMWRENRGTRLGHRASVRQRMNAGEIQRTRTIFKVSKFQIKHGGRGAYC